MSEQRPVVILMLDDELGVFGGGDHAACDAAARALIAANGGLAAADIASGMLRAANGSSTFVFAAQMLERPARFAVVLLAHGRPQQVYLVADRSTAGFIATNVDRHIYGLAVVAVLPLERVRIFAPRHARSELLALSGEFCPRCGDHQLHRDPIMDDTDRRTGQRICNACGTIQALRDDRQAA